MIGLQAPKLGTELDEAKIHDLQRFLDDLVTTLNNMQVLKLYPRTSDPGGGDLEEGMVWYRTDLNVFRCCAGGVVYTLDMTEVA